jgi:hypothetical protein
MDQVLAIKDLGGQVVHLEQVMEKDKVFDWTAFNPSILKHDGKVYIAVRSSNYEILETGVYRLLGGNSVENKIWFCELTSDLKLVNRRVLSQEKIKTRRGLEDARLHHDKNGNIQMYAIGFEDWIPRARIVECKLDTELTEISSIKVLPGIKNESIEKNWVAADGVETEFDYWHSPGTVYVDGVFKTVENRCEIPVGLRGSTPFIEHGENLIAVMHVTMELRPRDVYNRNNFSFKRKYTHYFVIANKAGAIIKVSKPFCFEITGVEFATGIMKNRDGYLGTYGIEDRIACLAHIPEKVVSTLFTTS